jgi:hypothetical protein
LDKANIFTVGPKVYKEANDQMYNDEVDDDPDSNPFLRWLRKVVKEMHLLQ